MYPLTSSSNTLTDTPRRMSGPQISGLPVAQSSLLRRLTSVLTSCSLLALNIARHENSRLYIAGPDLTQI